MSLQVHNQLSSSRFINMCVANWFLHIYIFSTIPLITDQLSKLSAPIGYAGLAMLTFAVGMFIPGPFGAHIMERRSRKEVFLKSLLAVGPLVILLLSYAKNYNEVLLITLLQGGAFGVAQTALGTTLVNDVLLSQHRNKGDLIYGWAGRIGIPLGLFFGYILHLIFPFSNGYWWTLIPCALSFLLVAQTQVPLKAPVKVPIVTLDRFFLPKSCPLALTMVAAPWTLGRITGYFAGRHNEDVIICSAFLFITIGVLAAFLIQIFVRRRIGQRALITASYLLVIVSIVLFSIHNEMANVLSYLLIGCGVGAVSSRHLMDWVTSAQHCQRGTAQNTYMLFWRLAFSIGFLVSDFGLIHNFITDALFCILSIIIYITWVGRQYAANDTGYTE